MASRRRVTARFHVDDKTNLRRLAQSIARKLRVGQHVRVDVPNRSLDPSEDPCQIPDRIMALLCDLVNRGKLKEVHLGGVRFV